MLNNPRWNKVAEPAVFSLESVIAWLEQRPPKKRYNYGNIDGKCLFGQYIAAHGLTWGKGTNNYAKCLADIEVPDNYGAVCARSYISLKRPWTFGAALKRAREVAEKGFRRVPKLS
jgi:hypothetical protein